jgi:hypothetical protein
MSHIAPEIAKVAADAPRFGHGDIAANPSPEPKANSRMENAMAATAPARIAPQETAAPARKRCASSMGAVGW